MSPVNFTGADMFNFSYRFISLLQISQVSVHPQVEYTSLWSQVPFYPLVPYAFWRVHKPSGPRSFSGGTYGPVLGPTWGGVPQDRIGVPPPSQD